MTGHVYPLISKEGCVGAGPRVARVYVLRAAKKQERRTTSLSSHRHDALAGSLRASFLDRSGIPCPWLSAALRPEGVLCLETTVTGAKKGCKESRIQSRYNERGRSFGAADGAPTTAHRVAFGPGPIQRLGVSASESVLPLILGYHFSLHLICML